MKSNYFAREFENACTTLDNLMDNPNNNHHRILVGTLITNHKVNPDKANVMLEKVKLYYDIIQSTEVTQEILDIIDEH